MATYSRARLTPNAGCRNGVALAVLQGYRPGVFAKPRRPAVGLVGAAGLLVTSAAIGAPVTAISRWSYSMYLSHGSVIVCTVALLGRTHNLANASVVLLGTLATSAAVFHGFEQPILRWRDRRAPPTRAEAPS